MKLKFVPIDYDYFDFEDKNYIKIIGRSEKNKRICVIDSCDTFFWAILKEDLEKEKVRKLIEKIKKIEVVKNSRKSFVTDVKETNKHFLGKKVKALKIYVSNYKDAHDIANELGYEEIEKRRGYDLGFITHYIIQKKFEPLKTYEIEGEEINDINYNQITTDLEVEHTIKLKNFKEVKSNPFHPRVLAYDIETDAFEIGKGEITMISIYGQNFKKVLTWKKKSKKDYVEYYPDEESMIEGFVKNVKEYSPDILTGYFSDGFDLPYLRSRADKLKVNFNLGLDNSKPTFTRGRITTGKIKGIVHVDILRFIRNAYSQYLQSETLSLDDVSSELLGEKKVEFDVYDAITSDEVDYEKFFEYNLKDSELTFKLFEKIWPDMYEITKITNEPLFTTSRSTMASCFELYVVHNLEQFDEIPEKSPVNNEMGKRRMDERYEGGFVYQPTPGLYENILFFDFSSMYGSVTVSYNLSKGTFSEEKIKDGYVGDYNGKKVYFEKKEGFIPKLLRQIIDKRRIAKEEYNKDPSPILRARSNAFKLIANAAYGYQGFFGARYYSIEAAASTAYFARENIKKAIKEFEEAGFKIVYSDTDSICIQLNEKKKEDALKKLNEINKNLPGIMELDYEGSFKRGIWVTKRGGEFGAKKKYALIDEKNNLKIRGFETVRRDWCNLARRIQSEILESILKTGDFAEAKKILSETVKQIKTRKVDLKDLIIRTKLKKNIKDYVSEGPHVVAAKKMKEAKIPVSEGSLISYYVSEGKGKRIGDKVKLPEEKGEYDIDYYLNNQILPATDKIFEVFGIKVIDIINGQTQTGLFDFH